MTGHVLLVCGGRHFADVDRAVRVLSAYHAKTPIARLVHGGGRGADTIAGAWAAVNTIQVEIYQADWRTHGRAAGPIRNRRMLAEGRPDAVLAFPGTTGTADMKRAARLAGIPVIEG